VLTQIDVMSENAFDLPILGVTPKNSLLIKKVTGLNPPDRSLFIGDYSQDGGTYQGRRVGNRNVVLTIDLNPNPALGETAATLRDKLHRAFIDPQVDGDYLKLVLTDENNREVYLVGYCEKFEGEIFDAATTCQISLICPDPYLRDNDATILTQPTGWVQVPFTYQGSAETGFIVRIYVTNATTQITLYNNGKVMNLVNPAGYVVDDIIVINTIRGQRSITLTRDSDLTSTPKEFTPPAGYITNDVVFYGPGLWRATTDDLGGGTSFHEAPSKTSPYWEYISTPIVSHLLASSQWLELHSANNTMRVFEGNNWEGLVANIKHLEYTSAYWGV
jgi:hypothetical protein